MAKDERVFNTSDLGKLSFSTVNFSYSNAYIRASWIKLPFNSTRSKAKVENCLSDNLLVEMLGSR